MIFDNLSLASGSNAISSDASRDRSRDVFPVAQDVGRGNEHTSRRAREERRIEKPGV